MKSKYRSTQQLKPLPDNKYFVLRNSYRRGSTTRSSTDDGALFTHLIIAGSTNILATFHDRLQSVVGCVVVWL